MEHCQEIIFKSIGWHVLQITAVASMQAIETIFSEPTAWCTSITKDWIVNNLDYGWLTLLYYQLENNQCLWRKWGIRIMKDDQILITGCWYEGRKCILKSQLIDLAFWGGMCLTKFVHQAAKQGVIQNPRRIVHFGHPEKPKGRSRTSPRLTTGWNTGDFKLSGYLPGNVEIDKDSEDEINSLSSECASSTHNSNGAIWEISALRQPTDKDIANRIPGAFSSTNAKTGSRHKSPITAAKIYRQRRKNHEPEKARRNFSCCRKIWTAKGNAEAFAFLERRERKTSMGRQDRYWPSMKSGKENWRNTNSEWRPSRTFPRTNHLMLIQRSDWLTGQDLRTFAPAVCQTFNDDECVCLNLWLITQATRMKPTSPKIRTTLDKEHGSRRRGNQEKTHSQERP